MTVASCPPWPNNVPPLSRNFCNLFCRFLFLFSTQSTELAIGDDTLSRLCLSIILPPFLLYPFYYLCPYDPSSNLSSLSHISWPDQRCVVLRGLVLSTSRTGPLGRQAGLKTFCKLHKVWNILLRQIFHASKLARNKMKKKPQASKKYEIHFRAQLKCLEA